MAEAQIGPQRLSRQRMISALSRELMGPSELDERFGEFPSTRYIVGRLSPANELIDDEENEGFGVGTDEGEEGYDEASLPLIMGFHPSSMGLSFVLEPGPHQLKVEIKWADYKFEEDAEEGGNSWRRYQRTSSKNCSSSRTS